MNPTGASRQAGRLALWRTFRGYGTLAPMRALWAFVATALVLGSCAQKDWIDRTLVTEDVTGSWYGRIAGPVGTGREIVFDLEQQASIVKGNVRFVGGGVTGGLSANRSQPGAIEGAVAGDVFRFRDPKGNLVGELKISGDEMAGQADIGSGPSPLVLRRVVPSATR